MGSAVAIIPARTLCDIRTMVVNDGSTDGTQAMLGGDYEEVWGVHAAAA